MPETLQPRAPSECFGNADDTVPHAAKPPATVLIRVVAAATVVNTTPEMCSVAGQMTNGVMYANIPVVPVSSSSKCIEGPKKAVPRHTDQAGPDKMSCAPKLAVHLVL